MGMMTMGMMTMGMMTRNRTYGLLFRQAIPELVVISNRVFRGGG
jgi:hypothetical protein